MHPMHPMRCDAHIYMMMMILTKTDATNFVCIENILVSGSKLVRLAHSAKLYY